MNIKHRFFEMLRTAKVFLVVIPLHGVKVYRALPERANGKRGVVYTAISGQYDSLYEPVRTVRGIDFVAFTDHPPENYRGAWQLRDLSLFQQQCGELANSPHSGIYANRFYKLNPHSLFGGEYDYAVYVDGSVLVKGDMRRMYGLVCDSALGIGMHLHYRRNCVYVEAEAILRAGKGCKEALDRLIQRYRQEGFPEKFGLREATIIVTDLKNQQAENLYARWWEGFCRSGCLRDQVIFPYLIWEMGLSMESVPCLGTNEYFNPMFRINSHRKLQ